MKREEKILLWSSNLWYFGSGLFGPLFAVFTQQIGGDIFSITNVWGAYLVSMGVFIVIIGKVSDASFQITRTFVLLGYALNALLTFGYLWVHNPTELLIVQVGLGFATALSAPTWSALNDRYSGRGKDGYVWGLSSGSEKIATGLAIFAGGFIVSQYSFQALFILMGCVQLLALFVQWKMFRK